MATAGPSDVVRDGEQEVLVSEEILLHAPIGIEFMERYSSDDGETDEHVSMRAEHQAQGRLPWSSGGRGSATCLFWSYSP